MSLIESLWSEYGPKWVFNRGLYSLKLKMMSSLGFTEYLFEKNVNIKKIDIFDFGTAEISKFLKSLKDEKKSDIVMIADKAMAGVLLGFSSIELDYGNPINWHLNPFTKVVADKTAKWYKIPDFDKKRGDIKAIWEASRFTQFLYFARAYLLTEDNKYYNAFSNQLENWLKENPYSFGVNYKCGQEATIRMVNALIAYSAFKDRGLVTEKDTENMKKLVEYSYRKVLSNFFYAHKCIKNNHTFSEILGLAIGSWCCGDNLTTAKAYRLMDSEIKNQFFADGGFSQYSFNYHRFTLQIIECLYKISSKTGIFIKEGERIRKSILLLYQMQNEDGDLPNYGSNDGALIFPLTSCGYRDFRPSLNATYCLITGKMLYDCGDYDEEYLWFGGNGEFSLDTIKKVPSKFDESGYYTLRHDEGYLMICLQNYKTRPSHMDQLHIDLWHQGINVFCDSGTYSYADELGRKMFSTSAHNTVKPSGMEQMNRRGAFMVTDWTKRGHVKHTDLSFSGTMISKNGYEHRREVAKTKKGYLVKDTVLSKAESCRFYFHTPCDVMIREHGFELYENDRKICRVKTDTTLKLFKTHRSLYYLKKEEINCVVAECKLNNAKCEAEFEIVFDYD